MNRNGLYKYSGDAQIMKQILTTIYVTQNIFSGNSSESLKTTERLTSVCTHETMNKQVTHFMNLNNVCVVSAYVDVPECNVFLHSYVDENLFTGCKYADLEYMNTQCHGMSTNGYGIETDHMLLRDNHFPTSCRHDAGRNTEGSSHETK